MGPLLFQAFGFRRFTQGVVVIRGTSCELDWRHHHPTNCEVDRHCRISVHMVKKVVAGSVRGHVVVAGRSPWSGDLRARRVLRDPPLDA
jgi:hypothetical protein